METSIVWMAEIGTGRERHWVGFMDGGSKRVTVQIGRKPAANIHHATRLADRIGCPLNQFVTINFSKTTCLSEDATGAFRNLLSDWFARWLRRHPRNRKDHRPTYVYTFEAAGGQIAVHWLVYIPRGLIREFWRLLPEWVTVTAGTITSPTAIKHRRIYRVVGAKRYILKGMDPHFARLWKIRPSPQGSIVGRRSGFSRNLGPAARRAAGYRPQRYQSGTWGSAASAL